MSAYCQAIKSLADQFANVGAPLDNKRLVLHLLAGLTDQYELQQKEPTPSFYEARSQLCMIESQRAEKALYAANLANQALTTTTSKIPSPNTSHPTNQTEPNPNPTCGRGRSRGRGRGRSSWSRGYNPGRGQPYSAWTSPTTYTWTIPNPNTNSASPPHWLSWSAAPPPPCPYPTTAY
ncbi:uncharacterized protein LOC110882405 [Helianthus annuus]|uniref:uncharacterized protein LOC110882405 n=1 Tax=Helianthus annuus TaxID=4232 RepID=UPI000B8FC637|nr:uncharacterized protein LOC110882405 [Helianthus annuus]